MEKFVIRPLFDKYQRELVAFANTKYGKDLIASVGGGNAIYDLPVVKVTSDSFHQRISDNLYRAVFFSNSPFVKTFGESLTMADIAYSQSRAKRILDPKLLPFVLPHFRGETLKLRNDLPLIMCTIFNSEASPETTACDGNVNNDAVSPWATCRDAAAGNSASDTDASSYVQASASYYVDRLFLLFDTSSLPDGATISSAVLSMYANTAPSDTNTTTVVIVSSNPASNTAIVTADFDQVGTTNFGSKNLADVANGAFADWTLNASGIANISKTGVSKFGVRIGRDFDNSAPTGDNYTRIVTADGGANKPKLDVTVSAGKGTYGFILG